MQDYIDRLQSGMLQFAHMMINILQAKHKTIHLQMFIT